MAKPARLLLWGAIIAGTLLSSTPVDAQPEGSYLDSCRYVQTYRPQRPDGLLLAECRDRRGRWVVSSLRYKTCTDDIVNKDGNLDCGSGYPDDTANLPPGNWRNSCRDAYVQGRVLYAECRNILGLWQQTSLNLKACPNGPVANQNGRLVCGGGGQVGSRLTLYDDANFSGDTLQLTGPTPDLRDYDFDNLASSIRVQGPWYVCTDPNYRGECTSVSGSFNLSSKWNNKISSARPAQ